MNIFQVNFGRQKVPWIALQVAIRFHKIDVNLAWKLWLQLSIRKLPSNSMKVVIRQAKALNDYIIVKKISKFYRDRDRLNNRCLGKAIGIRSISDQGQPLYLNYHKFGIFWTLQKLLDWKYCKKSNEATNWNIFFFLYSQLLVVSEAFQFHHSFRCSTTNLKIFWSWKFYQNKTFELS